MKPDEMLVDIIVPALKPDQRGAFFKLGLRRAQAISVVNAAVLLTFSETADKDDHPRVENAVITLGSVAPTIVRATDAESFLAGQLLNSETIARTAELAKQAANPIDDIRAPATYRHEIVRVSVSRCLKAILNREERVGFPDKPVVLWGDRKNHDFTPLPAQIHHTDKTPITTTINGSSYTFTTGQQKSLLRLLREEAGLIGTKEGCAEGECGACTIFLDGKAVMSCLVPAVPCSPRRDYHDRRGE